MPLTELNAEQVLITVYSDGTIKATPFDPNFAVRDANGRFSGPGKSRRVFFFGLSEET